MCFSARLCYVSQEFERNVTRTRAFYRVVHMCTVDVVCEYFGSLLVLLCYCTVFALPGMYSWARFAYAQHVVDLQVFCSPRIFLAQTISHIVMYIMQQQPIDPLGARSY